MGRTKKETEEEYRNRMAAYMHARYVKNRDIVRSLKVKRGCADCGYNTSFVALEFDHLDGRKSDEHTVARLMGKSINRIMTEIGKCEVVCANCHRIRTFNRLQEKLRGSKPNG